MKDKETIKILTSLLKKNILTAEENEAVSNAIGVLSWTMLHEGTLKNLKTSQAEKRRIT